MKQYVGKSVFGGVAIGKIKVFSKEQMQVRRERVSDAEREIERYEAARETAMEQLGGMIEEVLTNK